MNTTFRRFSHCVRGFAVLALLLVAGCASSGSAPESTQANQTPRAVRELDVLEAVYRYQMEHNASSATSMGRVSEFRLRGPGGGDPPSQVLRRLEDCTAPVVPFSRASSPGNGSATGVGKKAGSLVLFIDELRWVDDRTAEVEGGYAEARLSMALNTYRVELSGGEWVVVSRSLLFIS